MRDNVLRPRIATVVLSYAVSDRHDETDARSHFWRQRPPGGVPRHFERRLVEGGGSGTADDMRRQDVAAAADHEGETDRALFAPGPRRLGVMPVPTHARPGAA